MRLLYKISFMLGTCICQSLILFLTFILQQIFLQELLSLYGSQLSVIWKVDTGGDGGDRCQGRDDSGWDQSQWIEWRNLKELRDIKEVKSTQFGVEWKQELREIMQVKCLCHAFTLAWCPEHLCACGLLSIASSTVRHLDS